MALTQAQEAAISEVIEEQEGGWKLSRDADRGDGGWTFAGVTAKTWAAFYTPVTDLALQLQFNTNPSGLKQKIFDIYEAEFVKHWMIQLPDELFQPVFSCAINCGSADLIFQKALNRWVAYEALKQPLLATDGSVGPATLSAFAEAVTASSVESFIQCDFLYCWMDHYIEICMKKPEKLMYAAGWHNRVEYFRKA